MTASGDVISKKMMINIILFFAIIAAGVVMSGTDVATMNRTHSCKSLTGDASDNTTNGKKIDLQIVTCDVGLFCAHFQIIP
jgi:hypothetical protein